MEKVFIITGASSGLGREISFLLDKPKYKLVLVSNDKKGLQVVANKIDHETMIIDADLADSKSYHEIIEKTINKFGRIDCLINNAGINIKKPFYQFTQEEYDLMFALNTKAYIMLTKYAYNHMKHGKIVFISSVAGLFAPKYYSFYGATKHSIEGFYKGAKKDISKDVKLHIFHPYRLKTNLSKDYIYKSPEKHKIHPKLYAEYVVAKIENKHILACFYFIRIWLTWLIKLFT